MEETMGARIKGLRELAGGISARRLDALAGLRSGHVRKIELGVFATVRVTTLERICQIFGVSRDWLCDGIGASPSERKVREAVRAAESRLVEGD